MRFALSLRLPPGSRQTYAVVVRGRGEEGDERIFRNWTLVSPFSCVSLSLPSSFSLSAAFPDTDGNIK